MQSWPESHLPPLKAPGYVRMPGRPKKERKREPQEQPKAKRLSKVGIVIRCRKCKGIGHNRSTCDKRHGVPSSSETPGGIGHAAPQPSNVSADASTHGSFVPTATSNESSRGRGKRRASQRSQVTVCATAYILPHLAYILPPIAYILTHMQKNIKCTATARVQTPGQATMHLQANVPLSQASSSVNLSFNGGKACVTVTAEEPPRKKQAVKKRTQPSQLLLLKDHADP